MEIKTRMEFRVLNLDSLKKMPFGFSKMLGLWTMCVHSLVPLATNKNLA